MWARRGNTWQISTSFPRAMNESRIKHVHVRVHTMHSQASAFRIYAHRYKCALLPKFAKKVFSISQPRRVCIHRGGRLQNARFRLHKRPISTTVHKFASKVSPPMFFLFHLQYKSHPRSGYIWKLSKFHTKIVNRIKCRSLSINRHQQKKLHLKIPYKNYEQKKM